MLAVFAKADLCQFDWYRIQADDGVS